MKRRQHWNSRSLAKLGHPLQTILGNVIKFYLCELHLKLLLIMHACLKYSVCTHAVMCPWRSEDTLAKLILFFHLYMSLGINFRSPGLWSKTLSTHQPSLRPCQLQLLTLCLERLPHRSQNAASYGALKIIQTEIVTKLPGEVAKKCKFQNLFSAAPR